MPNPTFPPAGTIKPLGIGDLKVVKQTLVKYDLGEIAHIENVLQGESKDRKFRTLNRSEETLTIETETTQETEKDTQTTDRFELKREAEKTIQENMSLDAGVTVSASYGPVQLSAHADFATSNSISDSNRTSSNFAKEVTEKSLSKIQNRTMEQRITKTFHEVEETDDHGLNNANGTGNITGIYRWVDKHYQAQIYNYGKRLMFEFIVPEPAAFYIYSQNNKPQAALPPKPDDPGSLTHQDIQPWNYQIYVSKYKVQGVSPPPPLYTVVATALDQPSSGNNAVYTKSNKELVVPEGYNAESCYVSWKDWGDQAHASMGILVGEHDLSAGGYSSLNNEDGVIPIAVLTGSLEAWSITVEASCKRKDGKFEEWQLKTFGAIIAAYQALKANYDDQMAAQSTSQGITISGKNPEINRSIEKDELKKSCITLLTSQNFDAFKAMLQSVPPHMYPEIDVNEAKSEGQYIQFFEQAFEWQNITYLFYPYFWGNKNNWVKEINLDDTDPLFTKFLQAGSARVVIPVHPAYEDAVLYYIQTGGQIWNGGSSPVLNDPLYVSIVDELKSQQDSFGDAVPEGDPWDVIVPTSLVYLQADSILPDFTH